MVLMDEHPPPPGASSEGFGQATIEGFNINYKVNEKSICFYCLSVNYNNRSSTVGNDSQNIIHCCWGADIIYELLVRILCRPPNYILTNNNIARLNF